MAFGSAVRARYVLADYAKWKGKWVHYSKFPQLKINPEPKHFDPAALYFFPESFDTEGQWHKMRYKFTVTLPDDLMVLDLSEWDTVDGALELVKKLGVEPEGEMSPQDKVHWDSLRHHIGEAKHPIDTVWSYLQHKFTGKPGLFNKRLRELGYDAVFDDTRSIHGAEVQLLLLDPRKLKDVQKTENVGEGTGFKEVKGIVRFIEGFAKGIGWHTTVEGPKKKWDGYEREPQIKAYVEVKKAAGDTYDNREPYLSWRISVGSDSFSGRKHPAAEDPHNKHRLNDDRWMRKKWKEMEHSKVEFGKLSVELSSSRPEWKDWKVKTYYSENIRDLDLKEVEQMIAKAMHAFIAFTEKDK